MISVAVMRQLNSLQQYLMYMKRPLLTSKKDMNPTAVANMSGDWDGVGDKLNDAETLEF
jgi:hypothetical protein